LGEGIVGVWKEVWKVKNEEGLERERRDFGLID
jgi:hypothetical protein